MSLARRGTWFNLYPLLWGAYPLLALAAVNLGQFDALALVRPLLLSLLLAGLLLIVARRCTRDPHRAALLVIFWLSLFYTYGHVYTALEGSPLGHHRWLGLIWLVLGALGTGLILRRLRNPQPASQFAAVLGVILLFLALGQMALFGLRQAQTRRATADQPVMLKITPTSPDIYYIILDSYSRADMLQTYYGYDNSAFIAQLEALGFYVPPCAQSNYALTALSLSSSLNMDYLETYAADLADQNANWSHLGEYIQHSAVRAALEAQGYTTVSLESGVPWNEWTDAGLYLSQTGSALANPNAREQISAFEQLYLRTTALRIATETGQSLLARYLPNLETPAEQHYRRIRFELEQLNQIAAIPGPKFVFVHLMAPHEPYVFAADGAFRMTESADPGYLDEITWLNPQILAAVQAIQAQSAQPPVILLQADHGLDMEHRLAIFSAYYLPGQAAAQLYPAITPVNSFRLVLSAYLGADLPLLPDLSYYSHHETPYELELRTYPCDE